MKFHCRPVLFSVSLLLSFAAIADTFEQTAKSRHPGEKVDFEKIINDINISRAIALTKRKFDSRPAETWLDSGLGYLDRFHANLTHTVHVFSANADRELASWVDDTTDTNAAVKDTKQSEKVPSEAMSDYFNKLFRDDTYLYSSEASYLILRLGLETNKEEGAKFLNQIKFAISLPFTEKTLQLFVGDPKRDQNKELVDAQGNIDTTTTVGARYFVPEFVKDLKTDISAGMRGITNPFTQARFEYPVDLDRWLIRPVQYFEYSAKREFYEETDLYFDRHISQTEMIRLLMQRSTETKTVGMQYNGSVGYYNTFAYNTGLRLFVSLAGTTQIDVSRYEDTRYDISPHAGVTRYSLGGGWKSAFFRKWLFYELEPRVDFDMVYDWHPNYVIRYWLEIYFGDI